MPALRGPLVVLHRPRPVILGLILQHGPPKSPHHTLNAALDFEIKVEVIHPLQWKPRHPFSKFLRHIPLGCLWVLPHPLDDPPIHAGAKRFHEIIGQWRAALA